MFSPRRRKKPTWPLLVALTLLVGAFASSCSSGEGVSTAAASRIAPRSGDTTGTTAVPVAISPVITTGTLVSDEEVKAAYATVVEHLGTGELDADEIGALATGPAAAVLLNARSDGAGTGEPHHRNESGVVSLTMDGTDAVVEACDRVVASASASASGNGAASGLGEIATGDLIDLVERRARFDLSSGSPIITELVTIEHSQGSGKFCVPPESATEIIAVVTALEAASRRFAATSGRSLDELRPFVLAEAMIDFETLDRHLRESVVVGESVAEVSVRDWLPGHLAVVAVCTTFPNGTRVVAPDGSATPLLEPGATEGVAITVEWVGDTWLYRATEPAHAC